MPSSETGRKTGSTTGSIKHNKANNHNVLKFDVVKWNMFTMVKQNVLMKISSVLSVQTNAILDSNWSVHASGIFLTIFCQLGQVYVLGHKS